MFLKLLGLGSVWSQHAVCRCDTLVLGEMLSMALLGLPHDLVGGRAGSQREQSRWRGMWVGAGGQARAHHVLRRGVSRKAHTFLGNIRPHPPVPARDPEPLLTFPASLPQPRSPLTPLAPCIMWLGGQVLALMPSVRAGTVGSLRPC